MQSSFDLLMSLNKKGLTLTFMDGFLKVEPKSLITDDVRAEIKSHKPKLIEALLSVEHGAHKSDSSHSGISCWICRYYDGSGVAFPGTCRQFEISGQQAREIDSNKIDPDKGCHLYANQNRAP